MSVGFFEEPQVQNILPIVLLSYGNTTISFPSNPVSGGESTLNKEKETDILFSTPEPLHALLFPLPGTLFSLLLFQVSHPSSHSALAACSYRLSLLSSLPLSPQVLWMLPVSQSLRVFITKMELLCLGGYCWL